MALGRQHTLNCNSKVMKQNQKKKTTHTHTSERLKKTHPLRQFKGKESLIRLKLRASLLYQFTQQSNLMLHEPNQLHTTLIYLLLFHFYRIGLFVFLCLGRYKAIYMAKTRSKRRWCTKNEEITPWLYSFQKLAAYFTIESKLLAPLKL